MTLVLFLQALVIGLFLAMPIGPIALFCMRNSLHWGMRYGVITGIGSAAADALYGLCALFGVMALSLWFNPYHPFFHVFGGLVLCLIGLRMLWTASFRAEIALVPLSLPVLFCASFCLTLANPSTFFLLCTLFDTLGLCADNVSLHMACTLTVGIFLGSTLGWLFLSAITAWSCQNLPMRMLLWAHRLIGLALLVLGCIALGGVASAKFLVSL